MNKLYIEEVQNDLKSFTLKVITTLQCGKTRESLQARIKTPLILRQADDIPLIQACDERKIWWTVEPSLALQTISVPALSDITDKERTNGQSHEFFFKGQRQTR